jgi:hypothetical protein
MRNRHNVSSLRVACVAAGLTTFVMASVLAQEPQGRGGSVRSAMPDAEVLPARQGGPGRGAAAPAKPALRREWPALLSGATHRKKASGCQAMAAPRRWSTMSRFHFSRGRRLARGPGATVGAAPGASLGLRRQFLTPCVEIVDSPSCSVSYLRHRGTAHVSDDLPDGRTHPRTSSPVSTVTPSAGGRRTLVVDTGKKASGWTAAVCRTWKSFERWALTRRFRTIKCE